MKAYKLPFNLSALDDPARLGAAVRGGETRLDWSRVSEASLASLVPLLQPVDAEADQERLNLVSLAPELRPQVEDVLAMITRERARGTDRAPKPAAEPEPEPEPQPSALQAAKLSDVELRDELIRLALMDLRGPAEERETLTQDSPDERYLAGALAPRDAAIVNIEDQELTSVVGGGDDDPSPDPGAGTDAASALSGLTGRWLRQRSIGLTFIVDGEETAIRARASWGVYRRVAAEEAVGAMPDAETTARVWQRVPCESGWVAIPLTEGEQKHELFGPEEEGGVWLKARVRRRDHAGNGARWHVTLFLINDRVEPKTLKAAAWLFQAELCVEGVDGSAVFLARDIKTHASAPGQQQENATLEMLYRDEREYAVGHGTATQAFASNDRPGRAFQLKTVAAPEYEVAAVAAPRADEVPELAGLELDMRALAAASRAELPGMLRPLAEGYATWIAARRAEAAADSAVRGHAPAAEAALASCEAAQRRIAAALDLLAVDDEAFRAFQFMQRAMADQRVHTEWIAQRRADPAATLDAADIPKNRSWRPFQLAFILINLPALTQLDHPERAADVSALADLLWFPTGGGKTEAYLGLTAYTLAIRRRQGVIEGRTGDYGVAVLMRYTLRLLTLQQFQRAAALICASELLRAEDEATWGHEPFRLGLWVGRAATPNTTNQAREVLERGYATGSGSPAQLTNCPWCGDPIHERRDVQVDTVPGRTLLFCGNERRTCPFGKRARPREGLPVVVVDEEIYRLLPSLLIATVDKFARTPWKGEVRNLFGEVDRRCERHGFWAPDVDEAQSHRAAGNWPPARSHPALPARPLDLIIQDELHLISGPLGSMVGLYETAIDGLATWTVNGRAVRPKVIASTATIRRAADQVRALFLRDVAIFPPSGLTVTDSFFARRQSPEEQPGRRYLGICVPGMRHKAVLIRVYVALMAAAEKLKTEYGAEAADPYLTLVGYFSAIRELGGMVRVVEDDVRQRLTHMDERGLGKRLIDRVYELTSRLSSTEIPKILHLLEQPFQDKRPANSPRPLDVVLATNMISVGVDVPRLGLMVVAGQPKATAEYIQATSRVGRRKPGLVVTVFHGNRPRDISHYERFAHNHATFYRQVEPLSVTPFSSGAVERGLSGVLVSLVRHGGEGLGPNEAAGSVRRETPALAAARTAIEARAAEVTADKDLAQQVGAMLSQRIDEWVARAELKKGSSLGYSDARDGHTVGLLESPGLGPWEMFTAPHSLRNVEPGVNLLLSERAIATRSVEE